MGARFVIVGWLVLVSAVVGGVVPASANAFTESYDPATRTITATFTEDDATVVGVPGARSVDVHVEIGGGVEKYVQVCDQCRWTTNVDRVVLNLAMPNTDLSLIRASKGIRGGDEFKLEVHASSFAVRRSLRLAIGAGDSIWRGEALRIRAVGHDVDLNSDGDMDVTVNGDIGRGLYVQGSGEVDVFDLRKWTALPEVNPEHWRYTNWLYGSGGDDVMYGSSGRDRIRGQAGADTIFGFGGRDHLIGGYGPDRLDGGAGGDDVSGDDVTQQDHSADVLIGGDGNDALGSTAGNDLLIGGRGSDWLGVKMPSDGERVRMYGGAGDDWFQIPISGSTYAFGGAGRDRIAGWRRNWRRQHVDCGPGVDVTNVQRRTYRRCERLVRFIEPWNPPQT